MQDGAISTTGSAIHLRWVAALVVFAAEVLWLTSTHQAPPVSVAPRWEPLLAVFNEGYHYTAAIIFGASLLLTTSASFGATGATLDKQPGYVWWPWAALHASAVIVFARLTTLGFGGEVDAPALSLAWLFAWTAAGATTVFSAFLVMAPAGAWLRVIRQQWSNVVLALAAGTAVWVGGLAIQDLWRPLAAGTLRLSSLLLSFIYSGTTYDPVQGVVGSDAFRVEIFPVCSGYEGIVLVTVFLSIYLWIFRKQLSFPRAFILFPIGIVAIWLTNVVRVTALIVVGTSVSPEIAQKGFHSQAGWIGFTLVTLGLITIAHRWMSAAATQQSLVGRPGSRPELPLLVPLIGLMATTMMTAAASDGFDALYPAGVVVTGAILWHYRDSYRELFAPWTWEPVALGVLVFVMWTVLVPGFSLDAQPMVDRLAQWPTWLAVTWLLFRVFGSVVTVPFAEELAFRGYLIRKLVAKDFEQVRPGQFTWLSFFLSSLLFGLLHQHLLAGALAGAAFALALYRRGRVGDAILAHMVSNALIAIAMFAAALGFQTP